MINNLTLDSPHLIPYISNLIGKWEDTELTGEEAKSLIKSLILDNKMMEYCLYQIIDEYDGSTS